MSSAVPLALLFAAAGCGLVAEAKASPQVMVTGDFQHRARAAGARIVTGKFTAGPTTDIAVLSGDFVAQNDKQVWMLQPLLDGNGVFQGQFGLTKNQSAVMTELASYPEIRVDAGDFDGDGDDDLVFIGKKPPLDNFLLFSLQLSDGAGGFTTYGGAGPSTTFMAMAAAPGARMLACDVSGTGRSSIVVLGGSGSNQIHVAFPYSFSYFIETSYVHADMASWARDPNAKVACDDFNGDGKEDLVVTGGAGWYTVPVAFSTGDGHFVVNNYPMNGDPSIPDVSRAPGSQMVTGDFNSDGDADLFFTGSSQWVSAPIGISTGVGTWSSTISFIGDVAWWSREWGSRAVGGDFNGDGRDDVAIAGGADYFFTLPLALGTGSYTFTVMNPVVP